MVRWAWRGAVVVLVLGAFVVSLTPVADGDIFWHLAAGREMVRRHAWLRADPFTISATGRAWVDVHWLFQLGAYAVHRLAGLGGVGVVEGGRGGAGGGGVWGPARRGGGG